MIAKLPGGSSSRIFEVPTIGAKFRCLLQDPSLDLIAFVSFLDTNSFASCIDLLGSFAFL